MHFTAWSFHEERVKFLPEGFILLQSALISDRSHSLCRQPYLGDSLKWAHIILAFSLVYSGKNQFDNSVNGRNFSLRLGFGFSHQGKASNVLQFRAAAHTSGLESHAHAVSVQMSFFFFLCSSNTELSHFITLNWSQGILPGSELWWRFVFTEAFSYLLPSQTHFFEERESFFFFVFFPLRGAHCLSLADCWFRSIHASCPVKNYLRPKVFY